VTDDDNEEVECCVSDRDFEWEGERGTFSQVNLDNRVMHNINNTQLL
jgi:hypothetical protein